MLYIAAIVVCTLRIYGLKSLAFQAASHLVAGATFGMSVGEFGNKGKDGVALLWFLIFLAMCAVEAACFIFHV